MLNIFSMLNATTWSYPGSSSDLGESVIFSRQSFENESYGALWLSDVAAASRLFQEPDL